MKNLNYSLKLFLLFGLLLSCKLTLGADYYWVGGSGNWQDYSNHWATSSGGNQFYSSPPSNFDNVWFDSNSLSNGDSIVLDSGITHQCYNFNFNCGGGTFYMRAEGLGYGDLEIWSNVSIADSLIWFDLQKLDYSVVNLQGSSAIINAPKTKFYQMNIYSTFMVTMQSDLTVAHYLTFYSGAPQFVTNNYTLSVTDIMNDLGSIPDIRLGSSDLIIGGSLDVTNIDADSAHFIIDGWFQLYKPIHIHKITVLQNAAFENNYGGLTNQGLVVDEMHLNGEYYSGSFHDTIHTLHCYGNAYFSSLVCDTLILSKSPYFSEFLFDTLEVNQYMAVSSKPGYNIDFVTISSNPAELIVQMDTVCLDFMNLAGINAAGTAVYYAGSYSTDMGGNTGWNFSSCAPLVSGVWPGDVNGNLVTDNLDLIWLGQGVGNTGLARDSVSILYISHSSTDWPSWVVSQLNMKQADCNGNGIVDTSDAAAITQNYGLTHPAFVAPPSFNFPFTTGGAPLYFDMTQSSFTAGNTYSVPVVYGLPGGSMNQLYGIAFDIAYNTSQIDPASVSLSFPNSWLGNATNSMDIVHNFPAFGKLEAAVTRFNLSDANGAGTIAILTFTLRPTATGSLQLSFNDITAVLSSGFQMPVQAVSIPVTPISVGLEESGNLNFSIYPNPATELVYISGLPIGKEVTISLFDGSGRLVQQSLLPSGNNSREISIAELPKGLYHLLMNDGEHIGSRRLIIN